ncbi:MAG: hypothetical protein IPK27_10985 [Rhodanobacteraceae bacterium]|nr:hypothetical protein [Rhodanobacteraceae bacterium]
MNAIDLLFREAVSLERTHQLALWILLKEANFCKAITGRESSGEIRWEPERQLFDLAVVGPDQEKTFLELKMWGSLSGEQLARQSYYLLKNASSGVYVLLGTSSFEVSAERIRRETHGRAIRVSYSELLAALQCICSSSGARAEVVDFAQAYANAIRDQVSLFEMQAQDASNGKLYFYVRYQRLINSLSTEARIYTVNNPGGEVYILNFVDSYNNINIGKCHGQLYAELVNGRLCIKFWLDAPAETRRITRDELRALVREAMDSENFRNSGRLGNCMTVCSLEKDLSDPAQTDYAAQMICIVRRHFPELHRLR